MSADPRPGAPVTPSVTPSGSAADADADAIVAFAAHCRRLGLRVPVASTVVLTEALAALTDGSPAVTPDSLRWAARPVLASSRADLALVDLAVDSYFAGTDPRGGAPVPAPPVRLVLDEEDDDGAPAADEDDREPRDAIVVRWSAAEALHHRDFAECSAVERDELDRLIDDLRVRRPQRRSHRHRPSTARTGPLALRPTIADALRHGGEPVRLHRTRRVDRARPLVLLVDISGSMEPYSRALLRFGHALARTGGGVEVFALGTRLTRLTEPLARRDPDEALGAASDAVADWSGGTRLGDTLRELGDTWSRRGVTRGATVVIVSDGWDRGDPDELGSQMARLSRVAHRIVWVNPLKASPGYAPLARGMAAALPHVDDFVEGHSLESLERLAELVAT
jgi:uncharacterized protein with von Willebrand factor type A (vWA) domain